MTNFQQWEEPTADVTRHASSEIGELFGAVNELNEVLNITELLRFIRDLTQVPQGCNSPIEKSLQAIQFIQVNAQNYNI